MEAGLGYLFDYALCVYFKILYKLQAKFILSIIFVSKTIDFSKTKYSFGLFKESSMAPSIRKMTNNW